jgi:hypothetical protein
LGNSFFCIFKQPLKYPCLATLSLT